MIKKLKSNILSTNVLEDVNGEEVRIFTNICFKKGISNEKSEFTFEELIRKKVDKLYFKWKGHDNSINSLIDKKRYHQIK